MFGIEGENFYDDMKNEAYERSVLKGYLTGCISVYFKPVKNEMIYQKLLQSGEAVSDKIQIYHKVYNALCAKGELSQLFVDYVKKNISKSARSVSEKIWKESEYWPIPPTDRL